MLEIDSKLLLMVMLRICLLFEWKFQQIWLLSRASENSEPDTMIEMYDAATLHSAGNNWINAIQTAHIEAQMDVEY